MTPSGVCVVGSIIHLTKRASMNLEGERNALTIRKKFAVSRCHSRFPQVRIIAQLRIVTGHAGKVDVGDSYGTMSNLPWINLWLKMTTRIKMHKLGRSDWVSWPLEVSICDQNHIEEIYMSCFFSKTELFDA